MNETVYNIDLQTIYTVDDVMNNKSAFERTLDKEDLAPFKVNMTLGYEGEQVIQDSWLILKSLVDEVKLHTGDHMKKVIISVPAFFSVKQRKAVEQAVEQAELELVEIVNKSITEFIPVGKNHKNMVVVIYNNINGALDCTFIDIHGEKKRKVLSDGLIIGGENLDLMIVNCLTNQLNLHTPQKTPELMNQFKMHCDALKHYFHEEYLKDKADPYREDCYYTLDVPEQLRNDHGETVHLTMRAYHQLVKEEFKSATERLFQSTKKSIDDETMVFWNLVGCGINWSFLTHYILKNCSKDNNPKTFTVDAFFTGVKRGISYTVSLPLINSVEYNEDTGYLTRPIVIDGFEDTDIITNVFHAKIPATKNKEVWYDKCRDQFKAAYLQMLEEESRANLEFPLYEMAGMRKREVELSVKIDENRMITCAAESIVDLEEQHDFYFGNFLVREFSKEEA